MDCGVFSAPQILWHSEEASIRHQLQCTLVFCKAVLYLFRVQRGQAAHCPKITPLSYFPWKYPPPCESASVIVSTSCSRNHAHLCMSVPAECFYITSYFTSIMNGEEYHTCSYPFFHPPHRIWCMKNAHLDWFKVFCLTVCIVGSDKKKKQWH